MAERGIKCEFYTNGTLLTQRIGQEIISRSNINVINISCDGAQKATFESLRVGADFKNWKQSVGEFLAQAKRQRGQTLSTGMNIVASKQNLSEMGNLFRLAAKLGFDNVYVMHPIPVDETAALMCPSPDELSTLRQEDLEELAGSLGLKVTCFFRRPPSPHKTGPRCMQPWEHLFIRANGDVASCRPCSVLTKGLSWAICSSRIFKRSGVANGFGSFRRTSARRHKCPLPNLPLSLIEKNDQ